MVGRGLGLVMAFSFCFAPLHAVRSHAQPPQGAEVIRKTGPPCEGWTGLAGSELRRILKTILARRPTFGGYRPGGCQVIETRAPSGAYARCYATQRRLRWTIPQPLLC